MSATDPADRNGHAPAEPARPADVRDGFVDAYLARQLAGEQPPDLRARILAAVRQRGRMAVSEPEHSDDDDADHTPIHHPNRETTHMKPTPASRTHETSGWWIGLTLAATLMVAALLGAVMWSADRNHDDGDGSDAGPAAQPRGDENRPKPPVDPSAFTPPAYARSADIPVLAHNRLINPQTGEDLGTIDGVDPYTCAQPVRGFPGIYRTDEMWIDVVARRVIRRESDVRPKPGSEWCIDGISYRFDRTADEPGLVAERDGKPVWRIVTNPSTSYLQVSRVGEWLAVWDGAESRLVEPHTGGVVQRLEKATFVDAVRVPDSDHLLVALMTDRTLHVERRAADGRAEWKAAVPDASGSMSGARLLCLDGGTRGVVAGWHQMAVSGVTLQCLALTTGESVWAKRSMSLGVSHSKYRHDAYVLQTAADQLCVVSQASSGSFVELHRTSTGECLTRTGQNDTLGYVLKQLADAGAVTVFSLGEHRQPGPQGGAMHVMDRMVKRRVPVTDADQLTAVRALLCTPRATPLAETTTVREYGAQIEGAGESVVMWIHPADGWMTVRHANEETAVAIDGPAMHKLLDELLK
ncbi:MAG: hypothetical protein AB7S36_07015 [Planctomycetota bacterium]